MNLSIKKIFFLFVFLTFHPVMGQDTKPEVIFQHAFKEGDFLEKKLQELVDGYNNRFESMGKIVLRYGGDYTESFKKLTSKDLSLPHIAMVSEYNTVAMSEQQGLYIPIEDLMDIRAFSFFPVIKEFYSFQGRMLSYPFNCSVPALYYNKKAFRAAGLPDRAPQTWEEIEEYVKHLQEKSLGGLTFAWPAAYALEHFATIHNLPFASDHNGFNNPQKAILLLNAVSFVGQLEFLQDLIKRKLLVYAGERAEDAEKLFLEEKVSILLQGASRYGLIKSKNPTLDIGVAPYPYRLSLIRKPYAINIGGTSLWVIKGHPQGAYLVVADFLKYLSSPEIQAKWHQDTGYLPLTTEAYTLTLKSGFYNKNPAARIAIEQITRHPQNLPNGIRLAHYGTIRQEITEMLGRLFYDFKPVKTEVNALVHDINKRIREGAIGLSPRKTEK